MRYQFYREHKYVSAALNDLERLMAKADFNNPDHLSQIATQFKDLSGMLEAHAHYENTQLHTLLEKKQSTVHKHAQDDHAHQDKQLLEIQKLIDEIKASDEKVDLGYKLYLTYRKFVADNLAHLNEEETVILPELQRLYSDEELSKVEANTYSIMTPEQMLDMVSILFPHMNPSDHAAFLSDIKQAAPEKFEAIKDKIHA